MPQMAFYLSGIPRRIRHGPPHVELKLVSLFGGSWFMSAVSFHCVALLGLACSFQVFHAYLLHARSVRKGMKDVCEYY